MSVSVFPYVNHKSVKHTMEFCLTHVLRIGWVYLKFMLLRVLQEWFSCDQVIVFRVFWQNNNQHF